MRKKLKKIEKKIDFLSLMVPGWTKKSSGGPGTPGNGQKTQKGAGIEENRTPGLSHFQKYSQSENHTTRPLSRTH